MAADLTSAIANAIDEDPFGVTDNVPLPNYDEAQLLVRRAEELSAAFGKLMDGLEADARAKADELVAAAKQQFSGLQQSLNGLGTVGPGDDAMKSVMIAAEQKALHEAREHAKAMYAAKAGQIDDIKRRLHEGERRLAAFTKTFPNTVALLAVQRLDDPKRANYHANVARAGKNELTTLARVAIQTGDRALGAAVVARLYELSTDKRPFTALALADRLVGYEYSSISDAHLHLAGAYQAAYNRTTAFLTGRAAAPVGKLVRGLRDRKRAAAANDND